MLTNLLNRLDRRLGDLTISPGYYWALRLQCWIAKKRGLWPYDLNPMRLEMQREYNQSDNR